MDVRLLDILRCPFCGCRLRLQEDAALEQRDGEVSHGILCCQCCAYPVVSGIPHLCTGSAADTAMRLLGKGEKQQALFTLLGLKEEDARESFSRLLHREEPATFREALGVLSRDTESDYLFYRFSDPTYLCSRAVLQAIGQERHCFARRVLDLGGGTGHLTRTISALAGPTDVVLADITFWKLWLAKRFLAPRCLPVCCNANEPLPFARNTFSLVICSDAFHYIWSRRLLASEMLRLVGSDGTVVLSHLHNQLCYNESAGMPLAPPDYRNLFEDGEVRLFGESAVLDSLLKRRPLDLAACRSDEELSEEPALILVATRHAEVFRTYEPGGGEMTGSLSVNPLYRLEREGETRVLRLRFPSPGYAEEYAACKRYLPERVEWQEGWQEWLGPGSRDGELTRLAQQHVLLELPPGYV